LRESFNANLSQLRDHFNNKKVLDHKNDEAENNVPNEIVKPVHSTDDDSPKASQQKESNPEKVTVPSVASVLKQTQIKDQSSLAATLDRFKSTAKFNPKRTPTKS